MQALKSGGIATDSFDLLLISHLHGDHFGGLPFLILDYMWETRRKRALTIAGPAKLEERTWSLMRTMFPHFELDKIKHKLKFVVLEPETIDAAGQVQGQRDSQSAHQAGHFAVARDRRRRQVDRFLGRQRMER